MGSTNKPLPTVLFPSNSSSLNVTMTTTGHVAPPSTGSHALAYVLVPLGSLALVAVLAFIVVMMFRKNKLDKLRHHLMPMYNFDPQEEEDWEAELLDDRGRRIIFRDTVRVKRNWQQLFQNELNSVDWDVKPQIKQANENIQSPSPTSPKLKFKP